LRSVPAVAKNVDDLLMVQGWIYQMGRMSPVASGQVDFIREAVQKGAHVIALTSRMINVRDATLKELQGNGMNLTSAKELGLTNFLQATLPTFSPSDVEDFKLGPARDANFDGGVFFTQGQHKGVMLKTLLQGLPREYTNIVFVDDRSHHIEGMRAVFKERREALYSYQFTHSLDWVQAFNKSDKLESQEAWCALAKGLRASAIRNPSDLRFHVCEPDAG
jgi:hypothetical protein